MSDERESNICVVCRTDTSGGTGIAGHKSWVFAIGRCDHWVCYECSTRMRVLCQQNECPICRQQLDEVIFTPNKRQKFEDYDLRKSLYHNNHGIHFDSESAIESYGRLLEHPCRKCRNRGPFKTLHDLTTHLRKEHELHFCDLCVNNLKVFTIERKYYTRKELARHRKSGDPDERSHRGHPICTFCDERYVDEDDLHLHLRREHFYCHFCDPSGLKQFYADYGALRHHFIDDHFLCRECDSQDEKFTNAFNSAIDLQAHVTQCHSQNMSKSDLKKAKTISLDLFIHQRTGQLDNGSKSRIQQKREQRRHGQQHRESDDSDAGAADEPMSVGATAASTQPPRPEDFPSLGGASGVSSLSQTNGSADGKDSATKRKDKKPSTYSMNVSKSQKLNTTDEDFPALPGASNGPPMSALNSMSYQSLAKRTSKKTAPPLTSTLGVVKNVNLIDPLLMATVPLPMKTKQTSNKPLLNNKEEFPSLPVTKKKSGSRNSGSAQSLSQLNNNSNSFGARNGSAVEWSVNSSSSSGSTQLDNNNTKNVSKTRKSEPKLHSLPNIEDFPVLETKVKKTFNSATPPGMPSKPFTKIMSQTKSKKPPPGLPAVQKKFPNLSLSSVAQEVITTTTAGDTDMNGEDFYYINPVDFTERNQSLVREVEQVLSDSTKFSRFKETSLQFRQSAITGEQYYDKCIELFGKKKFMTIFSELLVLLPDICKQNELLSAQRMDTKGSKGAVPKGFKQLSDNLLSNEFSVCEKCRQVLVSKDQSHHMSVH